MSSAPLTRFDIESALLDVADELGADGEGQAEIIVVGGSFMTLHDLRDSTADVDSVSPLDDRVRTAVRRIADERGWAQDWLNDRATVPGGRPGCVRRTARS